MNKLIYSIIDLVQQQGYKCEYEDVRYWVKKLYKPYCNREILKLTILSIIIDEIQ